MAGDWPKIVNRPNRRPQPSEKRQRQQRKIARPVNQVIMHQTGFLKLFMEGKKE